MARVIRNENPTPKTYDDCLNNLIEEYTDIIVTGHDALGIDYDETIRKQKLDRWLTRLHNCNL